MQLNIFNKHMNQFNFHLLRSHKIACIIYRYMTNKKKLMNNLIRFKDMNLLSISKQNNHQILAWDIQ